MNENLSRQEAAIRAQLIEIDDYKIDLDVREAVTDTKFFTVTSQIALMQKEAGNFFVDFIGKEVQSVAIDGENVDFNYDGARITFPALKVGKHQLHISATGIYSTSGEGLHRFTDPVDNQTYLYTQFEPADSRRVFPNFEQPNLKAKFSISIKAPRAWKTFSNGAVVAIKPIEANSQGDECVRTKFAQTLRISTYLTAFIAGPYTSFTDEYSDEFGTVQLGFHCRSTLAKHFDLDDISTVTKQGLATFPKVFGIPYPWGKYDSVFVPEYNLGAMENPGCVTFNESTYIHRGGATHAQRETRANTILHEMSHMWFGDLATPI